MSAVKTPVPVETYLCRLCGKIVSMSDHHICAGPTTSEQVGWAVLIEVREIRKLLEKGN